MRRPNSERNSVSTRSAWRRVGICLAVLAAVDQAVLPIVRRAEARRYESAVHVRFENSDLFLLGPLTEYLREHPIGRKPRVAFFGDSLVWGYGLDPQDAIPSVFQDLVPQVRVLNFGINGFKNGNAYLISKAVMDAVDVFYLFRTDDAGELAHPLLPELIEVSAEDAARFGLQRPSWSRRVSNRLAGIWRLSRYSYRLQGAWFGTSTRQYLYLQASRLAQPLLVGTRTRSGQRSAHSSTGPNASVGWEAPVARGPVADRDAARLVERYPLLWDYAQLLVNHHKRGVMVELNDFDVRRQMTPDDRALFNAMFQPRVVAVKLTVPDAWRMPDQRHLTPEGCRAIAQTLSMHAAEATGGL